MTTDTRRRGRPSGYSINPDAWADHIGTHSQAAVAREAGLSPAHLSEMLAGTKGATPEVAERLALHLGCRPGTLFPQLVEFRVQVKHFTISQLEAAS